VTPPVLPQVGNPAIRALLDRRFRELSAEEPYDPEVIGYFVLVEPGDSMAAIEAETGCWLLTSPFSDGCYGDEDYAPCFEVLEEHPACYEIVFVFNDGGYGIVLLVPKVEGIDAELLHFCGQYAMPAGPLGNEQEDFHAPSA